MKMKVWPLISIEKKVHFLAHSDLAQENQLMKQKVGCFFLKQILGELPTLCFWFFKINLFSKKTWVGGETGNINTVYKGYT